MTDDLYLELKRRSRRNRKQRFQNELVRDFLENSHLRNACHLDCGERIHSDSAKRMELTEGYGEHQTS